MAVMPGRELTPSSAAEDQNVIVFGLRHTVPPLASEKPARRRL
jgi:hypothetical protein